MVIIDVRSAAEYRAGHIDGAINLDIRDPGFRLAIRGFPKDQTYLTYCNAGGRGGQAAEVMRHLGFADVTGCGLIRAVGLSGRTVVSQTG